MLSSTKSSILLHRCCSAGTSSSTKRPTRPASPSYESCRIKCRCQSERTGAEKRPGIKHCCSDWLRRGKSASGFRATARFSICRLNRQKSSRCPGTSWMPVKGLPNIPMAMFITVRHLNLLKGKPLPMAAGNDSATLCILTVMKPAIRLTAAKQAAVLISPHRV